MLGFTPIASRPLAAGGAAGATELSPSDAVTQAPVLGTASLTVTAALAASLFATGAPALGSPAFAQTHPLACQALAAQAPALDFSAIAQTHDFSLSLSGGPPVVDSAPLTQTHPLTAVAVTAQAPAFGTVPLEVPTALGTPSALYTQNPNLATSVFGQTHVGVAVGVAPAPDVGLPAFGQSHTLGGLAAIASGLPEVSEATAISAAAFSPAAMASAPPSVPAPLFAQQHLLGAQDLAAGASASGPATLFSEHQLEPQGIIASSVVGAPAFAFSHTFSASAVASGAPELTWGGFAQAHTLALEPAAAFPPAIGGVDFTEIPLGRVRVGTVGADNGLNTAGSPPGSANRTARVAASQNTVASVGPRSENRTADV